MAKAYRNKEYLEFIRSKPCFICGQMPAVPHHEGLGLRGVGMKPPDLWTVPLCHACHTRRHNKGVKTFWGEMNIERVILKFVSEWMGGAGKIL